MTRNQPFNNPKPRLNRKSWSNLLLHNCRPKRLYEFRRFWSLDYSRNFPDYFYVFPVQKYPYRPRRNTCATTILNEFSKQITKNMGTHFRQSQDFPVIFLNIVFVPFNGEFSTNTYSLLPFLNTSNQNKIDGTAFVGRLFSRLIERKNVRILLLYIEIVRILVRLNVAKIT